MPEQISSPSNKRIQWLHSLHSLRGRQEAGAFLIEGPHLLEVVLAAHVVPLRIVYDPDALQRTASGRQTLGHDRGCPRGAEIYPASAAAIERASDTQTPQGVVAAVASEDVSASRAGTAARALASGAAGAGCGERSWQRGHDSARRRWPPMWTRCCSRLTAPIRSRRRWCARGAGAHFLLPIQADPRGGDRRDASRLAHRGQVIVTEAGANSRMMRST